MTTDLILAGGTVLTVDAGRRVIEDGAVAIAGDRIAAVGTRAEILAAHPGAKVIDTTHHAILPGLIDGHAHAGHGLVKTLASGNGAAWSEACRVVYTTASTPEFWRAEAKLAALERLMFGVTTGVSLLGGGDSIMRTDDPAYGIAHCAGVAEIGIRAVVAVGPTRPPHPRPYASWTGGIRQDYDVPFERQRDTVEALIQTCHGHDRIAIATLMPVYREATHDAANVANIAAQGRAMRDLCTKYGVLFHQDGHRNGSLDLADRMFGLLGPDASMSHSTDLTEADIEAVVRTGTTIVHNPSAIASVRGYCPVPTLLDRGVNVMLGSDGTAPDRSTDMFRHMFQCMRLHQREHRDERLMPPGKLLEMVTIDAAKGLGRAHDLGSIEIGKKADIITIDLRKPHLAPRNMPLWRVVCFANGQDVDTVIVDGKILMQGRNVPHIDLNETLAQANAETELMLDRANLRNLLQEPANLWSQSRH
jgi:5-methylthioadenosine/S-adenosylhomocysteine deaminase